MFQSMSCFSYLMFKCKSRRSVSSHTTWRADTATRLAFVMFGLGECIEHLNILYVLVLLNTAVGYWLSNVLGDLGFRIPFPFI